MTYDFFKSSSVFRLQEFPDGSLLCNKERCIECTGGTWAEKSKEESFPLRAKEIYAVPDEELPEPR